MRPPRPTVTSFSGSALSPGGCVRENAETISRGLFHERYSDHSSPLAKPCCFFTLIRILIRDLYDHRHFCFCLRLLSPTIRLTHLLHLSPGAVYSLSRSSSPLPGPEQLSLPFLFPLYGRPLPRALAPSRPSPRTTKPRLRDRDRQVSNSSFKAGSCGSWNDATNTTVIFSSRRNLATTHERVRLASQVVLVSCVNMEESRRSVSASVSAATGMPHLSLTCRCSLPLLGPQVLRECRTLTT